MDICCYLDFSVGGFKYSCEVRMCEGKCMVYFSLLILGELLGKEKVKCGWVLEFVE